MAGSSSSIWRSGIRTGVGEVFAFGANTKTSGVASGFDEDSHVRRVHPARRRGVQPQFTDTAQFDAFVEQIGKMWDSQPNWTDEQLKQIRSPVLIVDGQYDEAIKREHTEYMAATIPGAGLDDPAECESLRVHSGPGDVQCGDGPFHRRHARYALAAVGDAAAFLRARIARAADEARLRTR